MKKLLFILKRRSDYSADIPNAEFKQVATGMYNSAVFVSDMLNAEGQDSTVELAEDGNSIDKLVTKHRPDVVFIEGYWVTPTKFDELFPLHKNVTWVVRCHSELPFLAQEGIAMGWTFEYLKRGILVAGNSPRIARELSLLAKALDTSAPSLPMLPNYYPLDTFIPAAKSYDSYFDVGCFGAIRPLKNQLIQAIAAYEYCAKHKRSLRFHVNAGRVESNGQNSLKNIRALFDNLPNAELVEHNWTSHEQFLKLLTGMDIVLQVSFSETFNIVAADAVNQNVPVVASSEISWLYPIFADPTSTSSIVTTIERVVDNSRMLRRANRELLYRFCERSVALWLSFLRKL
jgi:glycosyltransferase involved in cell wall biosynthesis